MFTSISTGNSTHFDCGSRLLNFSSSSSLYGFVVVGITHKLEPWP